MQKLRYLKIINRAILQLILKKSKNSCHSKIQKHSFVARCCVVCYCHKLMDDFKHLTGRYWYSYLEALLTSLVVGFAENYFAAFSLHHGVSPIESGLLISLPLILAAIFQYLTQSKKSQRTLSAFVKRSLLIQTLSLIGLAIFSFFKIQHPFFILFLLYSIYWYGHFSIQPAWNKWIADIIPVEQGQHYFSLRTRLSQVGIILGLIIGGSLLHLKVIDVSVEKLFFSLFLACFVLKLIVVYLFSNHPVYLKPLYLDPQHFKKLFQTNIEFFKKYALFQTTLFISAPFVAGYLLSVRRLNYIEFMIVMGGLFCGKVLTTYLINKNKHQLNPHQLFLWGGLIAAPLPVLWPFCPNVAVMFLVHFVSGFGWAAYEVGISLSFFKNINENQKIEVVSLYNYVGVAFQVVGTLLGALLFRTLFQNNFDYLFYVAGFLRLLAMARLKNTELKSTALAGS